MMSNLHAEMSAQMVRVGALDGLERLVTLGHGDFRKLLWCNGIGDTVFTSPDNRIPLRDLCRVLDAAALEISDDCLGLHIGASQHVRSTGVLGYVIQASPDLRSQLQLIQRYISLHQEGTLIDIRMQDGSVVVAYEICDEDTPMHRHDAESTMAMFVSHTRELSGQTGWAPESIHFTHASPMPTSERELRRFFGCPVYFSEPFDGIKLSTSALDLPCSTADPMLLRILMDHADDCIARNKDQITLLGRIRRLIATGLSCGQANIDSIAMRLAVTPRTLQRRLTEEGWTFADLLDATRRDLAVQYLGNPRISLTEAAFLVGYSHHTGFHRAFKRWFNQTPLDYQKDLLTR